ncbi:uncharacterized protein A4U43_C09F3640 [Asparagus officinalis]|uniref:F-box protein At3g26010-like beta-propeller domain-containing protein n=1 Tax=Asparagus officinalis TaxID=4686 RepID=A0A5P1E6W0_ASPOF|nr:uncharacterized protein A4U43_C09F3640 [Asparagus officinalis]
MSIPPFSSCPCARLSPSLDCCNGLLLVSARDREWHHVHYVCNPVTKSWVILPDHPEAGFAPSMLGFKPRSSPHFTVLSVDQRRGNGWSIYSSKVKKWSKKRMLDDRDEVLPPNRNKMDFSVSDGDVYIVRTLLFVFNEVQFGMSLQ